MPAAQGHEVPGGVLGPLVGPLVAAEVGAVFLRGEPAEAVVEDTVERGVPGVHADVLRGRLEDQRAEFADHRHRIHLLPEQVRGVQLDAHMGRAGELDELVDIGGIEHDVLRVQLEGNLHAVVGGEAVGFLPEVGRDAPLVVEHVQGGRVPGVDHPVDRGGPGFAAGQAGHGHHAVLSQPLRQPDGAADVLGMLLADFTLGVQRVAVAVQAGDRDAGALENREVVVAGRIALQDLVHGGDVDGRQEPTRVDFDAGQPQVGDDLERLGKGPVVQDCVVDAEFHSVIFFPLLRADSVTAPSSSMLRTPSSNVAQRGRESASLRPATSSRKARDW